MIRGAFWENCLSHRGPRAPLLALAGAFPCPVTLLLAVVADGAPVVGLVGGVWGKLALFPKRARGIWKRMLRRRVPAPAGARSDALCGHFCLDLDSPEGEKSQWGREFEEVTGERRVLEGFRERGVWGF